MTRPRLLTGSSGFSYKEWKGSFYPEDIAADAMLAYYAARLPTVEINNTFYRMPKGEMLAKWAAQVPEGFSFVIKASRRISHTARLDPDKSADSVQFLWKQVQALGARLGPILIQLPPNFRRTDEMLARLRGFLTLVPGGMRPAFEFRHESWATDEVHHLLADAGAAMCIAETDDGAMPPMVATADWGYLRLRREEYSDAELRTWAARIAAQPWREVYVFFKHEDGGAAPRTAVQLTKIFREA